MTHRWQKSSSPHRCAWCHLQNFYSTLRTTLHTCSNTVFPSQSKSSVPKSWLPRLKYIGMTHRGLIKSSHRRVPWDWSALCDMAVKTLTDCLTNKLSCEHVCTHARAHMRPHACKHTCTQNHRDRLFYQLHVDTLSWVFSSYYFKTLCLLFLKFLSGFFCEQVWVLHYLTMRLQHKHIIESCKKKFIGWLKGPCLF